jgi:peptidoglycan/xylan/chitin deacetylase (PgdA/CDA1 family)
MIKSVARTALHVSGALNTLRWIKRKSLRILTYHRFGDRQAIAQQCAHIREHYTPVSLTQTAGWLQNGGGWPDNALVVTVDDGYRDFYQVAYPVLREYGIPATVFLVSEFLDRRLWLWVDRVQWAYLHSPTIGGTPEERRAAARAAIEAAKMMPNEDRLAWLDQLPTELRVTIPDEAPPEYEPMTWDEVHEAAKGGVEFGAHTRTHPILSTLPGEKDMSAEIAGSKRILEERLGRPVEHFCYPNGKPHDFTDGVIRVVRDAGFRTATTMVPGLISETTDAMSLGRIGVDPGLEERYFAECAAGLRVK